MSQKITTRIQLDEQVKEIIYKLCDFLKEQKEKGPLKIATVVDVAANATGLSKSTIHRILREGKISKLENGHIQFSKGKKKMRRDRVYKKCFDDLSKCAIRRKVCELYTVHNVMPVMSVLINYLLQDNIIDSSMMHKRYISQAVKSTDFSYVKEDGYQKNVLRENPTLILARKQYIDQIKAYRKENRSIVYLDETYLHESWQTTDCWQYEEDIGLLQTIKKSRRLLIAHGGNIIGLLPKNVVSFEHEDDKPVKLVNWLHDVLIPCLPNKSVVVLNNVIYHCLQEKKESCDRNLESFKKLTLEDLFVDAGHDILILPPYHGDLNPLKYIFHDVKQQVTSELSSASMKCKIEYCESLFAEFRGSYWSSACDNVVRLEDEYIERDQIMESSIFKSIASCKTKMAKFEEFVKNSNQMECNESEESSEQ